MRFRSLARVAAPLLALSLVAVGCGDDDDEGADTTTTEAAAGENEELCALAEERELVLMPGHLLLYHPAVKKLKELTDSGELGEIRYVYGNRRNLGKFRTDENALGSLGAHDLSVILHLVGEEPSECWARGESFLGEVEDVVFCYLRFPSGLAAHLHLSWLDPHK